MKKVPKSTCWTMIADFHSVRSVTRSSKKAKWDTDALLWATSKTQLNLWRVSTISLCSDAISRSLLTWSMEAMTLGWERSLNWWKRNTQSQDGSSAKSMLTQKFPSLQSASTRFWMTTKCWCCGMASVSHLTRTLTSLSRSRTPTSVLLPSSPAVASLTSTDHFS